MEYYSAIKRNEIGSFVETWMDVATVIHTEVSQKEKNKYCVCVYIYIYIYFFFLEEFSFKFYLWLCWVFVSLRGLSLVVASGGHSSSQCAGLSPSRPLLLRSTGSRRAGSVIVAHGPSCSVACGILPDQGSNPCPLHWQADSQPLRHQGSPQILYINAYMWNLEKWYRLTSLQGRN